MKDSPEQPGIRVAGWPGKAMIEAPLVLYREAHNGQVVYFATTLKEHIDSPKEAFAKSARFGSVVTRQDSGFYLFRCNHNR